MEATIQGLGFTLGLGFGSLVLGPGTWGRIHGEGFRI